MRRDIKTLSIVCPAYQEEEVLPFFHEKLASVLDQLESEYKLEVIYVDDGSRDRTLPVLREMARGDTRVRYLSLSRNFGHQAALTAGMEHATGDIIVTLDSDLQHPPELIPVLLEKFKKGFDLVLTIREDDPRLGFFKRATSRWFYRIMGLLSDTDIRLAAADYRLMSRKAATALLQLRETHRFLRGMVQWLGFPVAEVQYQPASRKAGVSKYTFRRMLNLGVDGLLSFSKLPLRLSLFLGLLSVAGGLATGAWGAISFCLSRPESNLGLYSLLCSLYLVGGCILISLGIVGEYVGRVYEQVKGRPIYLLKDQSPELLPEHLRAGLDSGPQRKYGWSSKEGQSAA
jgi:glycosyltransferase involved in cell wall biosynthesis